MHCARLWLGWIHTATIGEATEDCKWQDLHLPRPCACVHLWGPRGAPMSPHDNGHVKCLSRPHAQVKRPMLAHSNRNGTTCWERFVLLFPCCGSRGPHLRAHLFSLVLPAIMLSSSLPPRSFILPLLYLSIYTL
jgi:hypothetical protein